MFPASFLSQERIGIDNPAASKKRVLEEAAGLLASADESLSQDKIFDRLLERERLGSTGLGHGVALPHARVPDIGQAYGAFLRLAEPVEYDALDGAPVQLVFALLVPEEATQEHLQLLAKLAGLFNDPRACERLLSSQEPAELFDLLMHAERFANTA